ncbi:DUF4352 domain-containing protein [Candidatus Saccharibacteria bacterium]|jgi:hypothetical protein|nr:MAG: DUF4352 domain-containing protein [Candidatus Saccharibacteria bacterium]
MNNRASRVVKTFYVSSLFGVVAVLVFVGNVFLRPKPKNSQLTVENNQTTAVLGQQTSSPSNKLNVIATIANRENDLLAVTVEVKNQSSDRVEFSPGLQLNLVDSASKQTFSIVAPSGKTFYGGGPLERGAVSSGTIYFTAPQDRSYQLVYTENGVASAVADIK